MDKKEEKLVIINGATRGLGLALVIELLKHPAFTILCLVRNEKEISGLSQYEELVIIKECDYSHLESVRALDVFFKTFFMNNRKEVCFVNNVSVIAPIGKIGSLDNKDIEKNSTINLLSNIMMLNSFLKHSKDAKKISILNISSGISQNPVAGLGLYGLAKNFTDYISKVIVKENEEIRVASFYPGGMQTRMQTELVEELSNNRTLSAFNYDAIYNQKLSSSKEIAVIIIENYLLHVNGWKKITSKIYDFQ